MSAPPEKPSLMDTLRWWRKVACWLLLPLGWLDASQPMHAQPIDIEWFIALGLLTWPSTTSGLLGGFILGLTWMVANGCVMEESLNVSPYIVVTVCWAAFVGMVYYLDFKAAEAESASD